MKKVVLNSVLINISPKFKKSRWSKVNVHIIFNSVKEMKSHYNIKNCNYDIVDENNNLISCHRNGLIDSYNNRYK